MGLQRNAPPPSRMPRRKKALHVEYLGRKKVPEGGAVRECFVLKRTGLPASRGGRHHRGRRSRSTRRPGSLVGTVLRGGQGPVESARITFRDIRLNPTFDKEPVSRTRPSKPGDLANGFCCLASRPGSDPPCKSISRVMALESVDTRAPRPLLHSWQVARTPERGWRNLTYLANSLPPDSFRELWRPPSGDCCPRCPDADNVAQ